MCVCFYVFVCVTPCGPLSLKDAVFFSCGETLTSKGMTYLTNSLFDYRSPENNGVRAEFILDTNNHKVSSSRPSF